MTIAEVEYYTGICEQEFKELIRKFEKDIAKEKKLEGLNIVYIVFYKGNDVFNPKREYVCTCYTKKQAEKEIEKCIYPDNYYYIHKEIVREDYNEEDKA